MKHIEKGRGLFDDVEQSPCDRTRESVSVNEIDHTIGASSSCEERESDEYDHLKKVLETQRSFDAIQKKNAEILSSQENVLQRLEVYKSMTFGFSQTDRKALDNLPGKISQKVREDIKQVENAAIDSINKHAEATMEKYGNLLDQKLEAAKKEIGVNKGIFLSWYNFWTMLILTVFSTSYTVYTAFGLCLWDEIWERIWLPLCVLVFFAFMLGLIIYLNFRND